MSALFDGSTNIHCKYRRATASPPTPPFLLLHLPYTFFTPPTSPSHLLYSCYTSLTLSWIEFNDLTVSERTVPPSSAANTSDQFTVRIPAAGLTASEASGKTDPL